MLLQTQSQWTLIGTTLRWEFKRSRKREGQAGMWFFTGLHEAHPGIHAGSLTAKQSPAGPSQVNTNTTGSPKTWSWLLTCPCPDCSLISWTSGVSGCIPSSFSGGTFPALGPDSQLENLAKATVSFVRWPVQRSAPAAQSPCSGLRSHRALGHRASFTQQWGRGWLPGTHSFSALWNWSLLGSSPRSEHAACVGWRHGCVIDQVASSQFTYFGGKKPGFVRSLWVFVVIVFTCSWYTTSQHLYAPQSNSLQKSSY